MLWKRLAKVLRPKEIVKGRYFQSGKYSQNSIKTANPQIFKEIIKLIFQEALSQVTIIQGKNENPDIKLRVLIKS